MLTVCTRKMVLLAPLLLMTGLISTKAAAAEEESGAAIPAESEYQTSSLISKQHISRDPSVFWGSGVNLGLRTEGPSKQATQLHPTYCTAMCIKGFEQAVAAPVVVLLLFMHTQTFQVHLKSLISSWITDCGYLAHNITLFCFKRWNRHFSTRNYIQQHVSLLDVLINTPTIFLVAL